MIKNLALVGCGHMGFAMLERWVAQKAAATLYVITPRLESLRGLEKQGVHYVPFLSGLPDDVVPDIVVFAVKPQILPDILNDYQKYSQSLFMTVAAGKNLDFYQGYLKGNARIVRAMPNLPAQYGEGATLLAKNSFCTKADMAIIETLLGDLGMVAWLENEQQMNAATALSGCGPAYYYLLTDILARVGREMGLPDGLAGKLARQTLIGSAALAKDEQSSAETLYRNIAVKGGMTEAALRELQNNDALKNLMTKALQAARAKGEELAG